MGWRIGVRKNTLRMSNEISDKLIEAADKNHYIINYSHKRGISFDVDTMEHMDFFWQSWAIEVLDDPSVDGDVIFISGEGDNEGNIWGYRFKAGKLVKLKALVTYEEIEE